MDSNFDIHPQSKHHDNYLGKKLFDIFHDFHTENKLHIHNNQFTRYASNCEPSVMDQIISNCPQKLLHIKPKSNTISDHCHLSSIFNIKVTKQQPKYKRIRNFKWVIRELLLEALEINKSIQSVCITPNLT